MPDLIKDYENNCVDDELKAILYVSETIDIQHLVASIRMNISQDQCIEENAEFKTRYKTMIDCLDMELMKKILPLMRKYETSTFRIRRVCDKLAKTNDMDLIKITYYILPNNFIKIGVNNE